MPAARPEPRACNHPHPRNRRDDLFLAVVYLLTVVTVLVTCLLIIRAYPCPPGEQLRHITWPDGAVTKVCADLP